MRTKQSAPEPIPAVSTLTAARALSAAAARRRPQSPAELAAHIVHGYRVTPTIAMLSDVVEKAVTEPDGRYIITCPPRTGKSVLVSQVLPVWALMHNPDTKVIVKSYGDDLAEEHSADARRLVADHPDVVGIALAADKKAVGRWRVEGHRGGMLAGGILSSTTGFGSDLLIVDDPIKGAQEADSAAYRRRLIAEFRASLLTRLMPGGSAIVVLTRWHEDDIAGSLLAEPGSRWTHINIPAVSTAGVPDALGREQTGIAMVSAIGRTAEDFAEIRRGVGERVWAAMYLGVPSTPEGGLIKAAWLDDWRLDTAPARPVTTCVAVDPSDSGTGDAAGVLAASLTADGVVCLIADRSRPMTSHEWGREAVDLAYSVGASQIAVEGYTTAATYERVIREALARHRHLHPDAHPIRVATWRGKGDAVARSAPLLQAMETGRFRLAGHHPTFETAAVSWQAGMHQPDQVAAAVIAFDALSKAAGAEVQISAPIGRLGGGVPTVHPLPPYNNPWARRPGG